MASLATNLRRDLERTIIDARQVAERGARSAIEALTVSDAKSGTHLDAAGRELRSRLRAHARQLGDTRSAKGEQAIAHLVCECAYEHWHRMLFARFLAENDLLIEPASNISVSLDDVEELAREEHINQWELASRYAQRMLPQIFRPDDPVLAVALPTETRLELESLLESLPSGVFKASDSLGWVYQFWRSAEKDAVNASGVKIGADELPAVTQLFTEPYMVRFLIHNTLGAWWAGKQLTSRDCKEAESEEALRKKVAVKNVDWEYLRFVREEEDAGPWRPAAGTFDGWPRDAKDLKILDPCCGSGHFLVELLHHLVPIRMAEEDLDLSDAIDAVLRDNLHGLEIDERCTQIAAFALAFEAWKMLGKPAALPLLNIACSGIAPQATKDEWLKLADKSSKAWESVPKHAHEFIRNGLVDLHEQFSQAPTLGSLIDPTERQSDLITADYETLRPFLDAVLAAESDDAEKHERAIAARGIAKASDILGAEYSLIITNVPYLKSGNQDDLLKNHLRQRHPEAKADLATAFLDRIFSALMENGTSAIVTQQYWLVQKYYEPLRQKLLRFETFNFIAALGPGAFDAISGSHVNVVLQAMTKQRPTTNTDIAVLTVEQNKGAAGKSHALKNTDTGFIEQSRQRQYPEVRIIIDPSYNESSTVGEVCDFGKGSVSGDGFRFLRCFWESHWPQEGFRLWLKDADATDPYSGRSHVCMWEVDGHDISEQAGLRVHGQRVWGRRGIAIGKAGSLRPIVYTGEMFDDNIAVLAPHDLEHLPAVWAFTRSDEFVSVLRRMAPGVTVTAGVFPQAPFNEAQWQEVAKTEYPNGLPEPESDDPTQWLFHGRPDEATPGTELQVAVARLLGYRWPAELDPDMRLSDRARSLVQRCAEMEEFADDDGIVCLSPVRGETLASNRLRQLLSKAFGDQWSNAAERRLLQSAGDVHSKGQAAASLEAWLRDEFFREHCGLFHHRPFIWHIWDGRKDGFHALVNYHKLAGPEGEGRRTLEALTYSYLGDWIKRQEDAVKSGEAGAEAHLAAAMELKEQLEKVLAGEPPYDIFVRWKPVGEQPIGWEPDINDGVRMNIRPFMNATLSKGKKGAGVLRWKPNIKWTKDRGKEPERLREKYPWFWGWDEKAPDFVGGAKFDGNRWNDLHYTNAFKQAASERAAEEAAT